MGHLFVVQADLAKLAVTDVIVPCDDELNFHAGFKGVFADGTTQPGTFLQQGADYLQLAQQESAADVGQPGLWLVDGAAARRSATAGSPLVWLFDSSRPGRIGADSAPTGLLDRLRTALEVVKQHDRTRPRTIAMVLPGINAGGYAGHYSQVISGTLDVLQQAVVAQGGPDIVLSVLHRADYAAVQHLRRGRRVDPVAATRGAVDAAEGRDWDAAEAAARRLAELAAEGQLVLFIGAGASIGAGLTDWWGLLKDLAGRRELSLGFEDLQRLDARDAAMILASGPRAAEAGFREEVAGAFQTDRYPLTQALLASLRLGEAVTTNYDLLYETAYCAGDRSSLRVLPREAFQPGVPWLMKIHGDAKVPGTIVLSRDDYIRFDADSIPMASVLQAMMMTRHILFVGYSVSDENVVRMARQVLQFNLRHLADRAAASTGGPPETDPESSAPTTQAPAPRAVGTVLVPRPDPVKKELWNGVLDFVDLPPAPTDDIGRNVAIFLDLLGMWACRDAPYFLQDRYRDLLDEKDDEIRKALRQLQEACRERTAAGPVADSARRFLAGLGGELG